MNIIANRLLAVVLANIFFLSTGLAGVSFGYASEIFAVLLFFVLLADVRNHATCIFKMVFQSGQPLLFALCVYLFIDGINFWIMGDVALAWQKYRVTAVLMMLFVALLLVKSQENITQYVMGAIGCATIVVVIFTLGRYFLPWNLPLFYIARFSLRSDYNMFATLLITGLICLVFAALTIKSRQKAVIALLFLPTIIAITILSGSRRVLILLPAVLLVLAAALIIAVCKRSGIKKLAVVSLCILILAAVSSAQTVFLKRQLSRLHQTQGETRSVIQSPGEETQLTERYETIHSSSILTKRLVIWRLAIQELSKFSYSDMVFGRGGGENILLYDKIEAPLDEIYPNRETRKGALSAHNMLLADLIDGGVLKLAALTAVILSAIYVSIFLSVKNPVVGFPIGMILAICLINSLVSNRFGLVYDRFLIIFTALAVMEYSKLRKAQNLLPRGGSRTL